MSTVWIIYSRYYDYKGKELTIGGVQTYISNLCEILREKQYEVCVVQAADSNFEFVKNNVKIIGVRCKYTKVKTLRKSLIKEVEQRADKNNDVLIFGTSTLCVKNHFNKSISIQHGIYWDLDRVRGMKNIPVSIFALLRCIQAIKEVKQENYAKKVVCVDYNYVNWYRTQAAQRGEKFQVIPNFVSTDMDVHNIKREEKIIKIIFARRFEVYRGVNLVIETMPSVLEKYKHVKLILAGNGPEEARLRDAFSKFGEQVEFITYAAEESIKIHQKMDIALVPSIASEGTSLSLLEAMWAGCAVIATNVGGMSNLVFNNYNGLIIMPTSKQLRLAIEDLVENQQKRTCLTEKAREVVCTSFSREVWANGWKNVIDSLEGE